MRKSRFCSWVRGFSYKLCPRDWSWTDFWRCFDAPTTTASSTGERWAWCRRGRDSSTAVGALLPRRRGSREAIYPRLRCIRLSHPSSMIDDRWAMCGWRSPLSMTEAWQSLCRSSRVGQHLSIANVVTPATRLLLAQQCKGLEMLWLRPSRSALLSTHCAHSHLYPRLRPCYFTLGSLRKSGSKHGSGCICIIESGSRAHIGWTS